MDIREEENREERDKEKHWRKLRNERSWKRQNGSVAKLVWKSRDPY